MSALELYGVAAIIITTTTKRFAMFSREWMGTKKQATIIFIY